MQAIVSICCTVCEVRIIDVVPAESAPTFWADCHPHDKQKDRTIEGYIQ